ncbi:MAG: DUF4375 domain-containing protein [Planctomycetota bacterium]
MLYVLTGVAALAAIIVTVCVLRRGDRKQSTLVAKPYAELRADMIESALSQIDDWYEPTCSIDEDLRAAITQDEVARLSQSPHGDRDAWHREVSPFFDRALDSVLNEHSRIGGDSSNIERMSVDRRAFLVVFTLESQVNNGGFDQYYLNSSGDTAWAAPACLRHIGMHDLASLVERANGVFTGDPPPHRAVRLKAMGELGEHATTIWNATTQEFFDSNYECFSALVRLICDRRDSFFRVD